MKRFDGCSQNTNLHDGIVAAHVNIAPQKSRIHALILKQLHMINRNICIFSLLVICSLFLLSYREGPANQGWDCTGAETGLSNPKGCSNGGGCHGNSATAGITVNLELDSAGGAPVLKYKGGKTYTFKITGQNTTTGNLPKFGFQVSCILGDSARVTPTNAGAFAQSGLPAGVHFASAQATYYVTDIVEHDQSLSPDSLTGGKGTIYRESFNWTAPVKGTGTVSFWGVLNAVNGNGNADGNDKWNTKQLIVEEDTSSGTVNEIAEAGIGNAMLNVYPNPAIEMVNIDLLNASEGTYDLNIIDLQGRILESHRFGVAGNYSKTTINTANWPAGIYFAEMVKGGDKRVMRFVKQ